LLPKPTVTGNDGVFMITVDGNYEASLLLVDSLWGSKKLNIEGDPVVAVPSRDVLVFTGSKNIPGLKKLREVASKNEYAYPLTSVLHIYRNGKFEEFESEPHE
jgi:uncharacterized protein YtpQ (UPF0354 family)